MGTEKRRKPSNLTKEERKARVKKIRGNYKPPKYTLEEKELRAKYKKLDNLEREQKEIQKRNLKRELKVLKFMLKTDVKYLHHGQIDSLKETIKKQIQKLKDKEIYEEYNPYIWNYQGEGNSYMSLCIMGRIWRHPEFSNIYEVPLDGTYTFHVYDTGQRGLGAFDHITVKKVEEEVKAPHVNPGSIIPTIIE